MISQHALDLGDRLNANTDRAEQFRLTKLSLFNWGTFAGLHQIPISADGFLFVGRSGSGKSTLLDAFTALLIPPRWTSFNAAAREGERARADRNLVTYVRGAWADQSSADTGEIASQTLRPKTTWSALSAEYADGFGKVVTLVQVFWIRGTSNATTDLRRHYMIADRPFCIQRELAGFAEDLDLRGLKKDLPDLHHFSEYERYGERLRLLLRIDSSMALKLLHKTQSAKNLGDLNAFLREFMLDPPRTFEVADRLVEEFVELDQAHRAVVTARRQIEVLAPARDAYAAHQQTEQALLGLDRQLNAIDPYLKLRRRALLEAELARLVTDDNSLAGRESEQQAHVDQDYDGLQRLEEAHRAQGGGRIEALERDIEQAGRERDKRLGNRKDAERLCQGMDWTLPDRPEALAELTDRARDVVERWQQEQERTEQQRDAIRDRHKAVAAELGEAEATLQALLRQPSNIPARMLALRARISDGLGIPEVALPFVGELVQVRPEAAEWSGAIERVLHNFATSLLVQEPRYPAVSRYVNDTHLGQRLVYHRVGLGQARTTARIGAESLIAKLELKDSPYRDWLFDELSRRFDYSCTQNLRAFQDAERAVTREGQIKHGRGRHEKDDRHRIDDRERWVLGFDNRDKLALFQRRVGELRAALTELDAELAQLTARRNQSNQHALSCRQLMNLRWEDIDVATQLDLIAGLEAQLRTLRDDNRDLAELGRRIDAAKVALRRAREALSETQGRRRDIQAKRNQYSVTLNELDQELAEIAVEPEPARALADRFDASPSAAARPPLTLANLDARGRQVERELRVERDAQVEERNELKTLIERQFGAFKRGWPMEAVDLDETLASAAEYLTLLTRIEQDGLPRFEERFSALLKEQSTENLAALNRHVDEARKQIRERMALVNEGLAEAEFNTGTHLQIQVTERQLPDVLVFREQVREVLEHAYSSTLDAAEAEARFALLSGIVKRLSGDEPDDKRWRQQVLDVRLHVEFIGRELDTDGNEVEVYRSGAGKSGGQREKLATTCLAAALRYQLGGREGGLPQYAPVILDEAFGKADNEFTELAMRIFERFGFQMIVATPLKSVMTLEPFIGGACFVAIEDRKCSTTLQIAYDQDRRRLALPERVGRPERGPNDAGRDGEPDTRRDRQSTNGRDTQHDARIATA